MKYDPEPQEPDRDENIMDGLADRLDAHAIRYANDYGYCVASDLKAAAKALRVPAQIPFNLGDIVSMRDGAPFASEWRGIKMKVVSLRIDPQGTYWVSVVDETDGYPPHHRGNGFYDGETTDIDAGHLCSVPSTQSNTGAD